MGFGKTVPILRMFDEAKAKEFYVDFLGFAIDWEHRFESGAPLYMQVSLGSFQLHVSEHYGDGTPGFDFRRIPAATRPNQSVGAGCPNHAA